MNVEEIFSKLATHMAKGVLIHNQMVSAFNFLGLKGYQKSQEYHYYEETKNYRNFLNYCLNNYYKIVVEEKIEMPEIIPTNWYKYMKMDVDISTKKNGTRDIFRKWIAWETETKKLLESSYHELSELNEYAAALQVLYLIKDVEKELRGAQEQLINLETINYDLSQIVAEQQPLYNLYKEKIKNLYEDDVNDQISTKKVNYSSW